MAQEYEVLVIGGGPAGLSAALYLARYDRRVALFDSGQGRSSWAQVNHNYLGFPGGVAASRLRALGHEQLSAYPQVTCWAQQIDHLEQSHGAFVAQSHAGTWQGQAVILCTGVMDRYPCFDGWEAYIGRSMFWCLICDGYECKGARVVVLGHTNATAIEALQLQRFTPRLTVLTNHERCEIDAQHQSLLQDTHIPLICDRLADVEGEDGQLIALYTQGGHCLPLDRLFCQPSMTPQTQLARGLGVQLSPEAYIQVDTEQRTNIPGVYAAGDVTRLHSHQITTAVHEGGTAASSANYALYLPPLRY